MFLQRMKAKADQSFFFIPINKKRSPRRWRIIKCVCKDLYPKILWVIKTNQPNDQANGGGDLLPVFLRIKNTGSICVKGQAYHSSLRKVFGGIGGASLFNSLQEEVERETGMCN